MIKKVSRMCLVDHVCSHKPINISIGYVILNQVLMGAPSIFIVIFHINKSIDNKRIILTKINHLGSKNQNSTSLFISSLIGKFSFYSVSRRCLDSKIYQNNIENSVGEINEMV